MYDNKLLLQPLFLVMFRDHGTTSIEFKNCRLCLGPALLVLKFFFQW